MNIETTGWPGKGKWYLKIWVINLLTYASLVRYNVLQFVLAYTVSTKLWTVYVKIVRSQIIKFNLLQLDFELLFTFDELFNKGFLLWKA